MGKTAILLGATGLTGGYVLDLLLNDDRYDKILIFGRRSIERKHPRINEFVIDLLKLEDQKDVFKADVVFCCIGTTNAKTSNKELYKKIDYGIPITATRLCVENHIDTFLVMSSMGADKNSRVFYNRTKGEMEEVVLSQKIKYTYILQPSLIGGNRNENRTGEYLAKVVMMLINPILIGGLKKYRTIHPETIAKALVYLANSQRTSGIIQSDQIKELAKHDH